MARIVIAMGAQRGRVFHLKQGLNRIGRTVENDFQIPDASVSSHHCEILQSNTSVSIRDLNSTNGTLADGIVVGGEAFYPLQKNLRLGSVHLELETEEVPVVRIPEVPMLERPVSSGKLPDGSPACPNHPEAAALFKCTKCEQTLCDCCVRGVGRKGGVKLVFCTLCSGPCVQLPSSGRRRKKKTILGWLTSTLKLPFSR
jgi:hypothetical protein